jgi:hypothetical protein
MIVRPGMFLTGSIGTGEGRAGSGALTLLGAETDGVAIDFTDLSIVVRDTVTPANNFSGNVNDWLTYSSPSTKWVLNSSGLFSSGTTIRTEYDGSGVALGARFEEARTSLALHSCDLTNAAWTASNMTAAKTATGPDGVANSATTITATAGNATILQSIVSASAARFTSCYIKRRTGSGTIEMTQDGGVAWAAVTVTADWTRVNIASATVTNPSVGLRVVTSGDAVDVGFFNITTGAFNTSPIRTTTASVARAYDNVFRLLSGMQFNAAASTLYAKFRPFAGTTSTNRYVSLVDGTSTNHMSVVATSGNTGNLTVTATTSQASIVGTTWAAGDVHKIAASAQVNAFKMAMDGVSGLDDTAGIMPVSPTHFRVSGLLASFGSVNSHVEQVMYLPRTSSAAELVTVTT